MRELLIATGNKGKLVEIEHALQGLPFVLKGLKEVFPQGYDIEEPGETFEGNAIIKAMTFGKRSGMLTLADDSGLEVDALDGAPGVMTARYAPGSDEDRYRKLLDVMKAIPDEKRGAQFRCVTVIYDPERNDKIRICEGVMQVRIAREPKGNMGFGYDPIIFVEETQKMHAEETTEERNKTSHRGKALAKVREVLLR